MVDNLRNLLGGSAATAAMSRKSSVPAAIWACVPGSAKTATLLADDHRRACASLRAAEDREEKIMLARKAEPVPVPDALRWRPEDVGYGISPKGAGAGHVYGPELYFRLTARPRMQRIEEPMPGSAYETIVRWVPFAEAQARADEIVRAILAYEAEDELRSVQLGADVAEEAYDAAKEAIAAALDKLIALASPDIESMRAKIDVLARYLNSPSEWDRYLTSTEDQPLDLRLAVSIARDVAAFFGLLDASTNVADATQIA